MSEIRQVFLDLGNVLVFHDDDVLCRRLSQFGGDPPDVIRQRLLRLWEPCNRGTLAGDELRRVVCEASGARTVMDRDEFVQAWSCHFRIHHEVLPLVKSLLRLVPVALLSNTNEMHWKSVLPRLPLVQQFSDFILSYEVHLVKPEHEIFHTALRRAGSSPEACAFFDDIPDFVNAASSLGIHGRVFTTAAKFREQLAELGLEV